MRISTLSYEALGLTNVKVVGGRNVGCTGALPIREFFHFLLGLWEGSVH